MICPNCSAQLPNGAQVCGNCGTRFTPPQAPQYQAPQAAPQQAAPQPNVYPRAHLKTDYNGALIVVLGWVTLGIYPLIMWTKAVNDVNTVCTPRDGKKSMHYCLMVFIFSWLTLGILPLIWSHKIFDRVGTELKCRGIQDPSLSAGDFWIWGFLLGSITLFFVQYIKFFNAVNAMNADYNARG